MNRNILSNILYETDTPGQLIKFIKKHNDSKLIIMNTDNIKAANVVTIDLWCTSDTLDKDVAYHLYSLIYTSMVFLTVGESCKSSNLNFLLYVVDVTKQENESHSIITT